MHVGQRKGKGPRYCIRRIGPDRYVRVSSYHHPSLNLLLQSNFQICRALFRPQLQLKKGKGNCYLRLTLDVIEVRENCKGYRNSHLSMNDICSRVKRHLG